MFSLPDAVVHANSSRGADMKSRTERALRFAALFAGVVLITYACTRTANPNQTLLTG
jgi:hypothetical protein